MSQTDPNAVARPATTDAERIARAERAEALTRGDAVLVGTVAGVVEWTDGAWTRLTGFPLVETVQKPITHFLERAGLERELVEFVAHHFLEGRDCTVALPFDTFDGRHVQVTLEVEPWRDVHGEITRFVAVAREAEHIQTPSGKRDRDEVQCDSDDRRSSLRNVTPRERIAPLSQLVENAVAHARERLGSVRGLDVHLDSDGPVVTPSVAPEILAALVESATASLREQPDWLSIVGGALCAGRSHHSLVHPVANRAVIANAHPTRYVEIHDTGPNLGRETLARLRWRHDAPATTTRERALLGALRLADEAGIELLLDSTPGCGTQALLVLPIPTG